MKLKIRGGSHLKEKSLGDQCQSCSLIIIAYNIGYAIILIDQSTLKRIVEPTVKTNI